MEFVIRYLKNGQWKTVDGSYYSIDSTKEKVAELEAKGYRTQVVRSK